MPKNIYRDGVLFATGDSLEVVAGIAGEDVSRYSFSIGDLQAEAIKAIDQAADNQRAEYITDILGQPTVYRQKYEETVEFRANGTVGPYLAAESTRRGITVDELATEIETTRAQWNAIDAQIEAERVGGKQDVREAADQAGVEAARGNAVAAIGAL